MPDSRAGASGAARPAGSRRQRGAAAGLRWHRPGRAGSRRRRQTRHPWRTPRRLRQRRGRPVLASSTWAKPPDRVGSDRAAAGPNDDRRRHRRMAERRRAGARQTATARAGRGRRLSASRASPRASSLASAPSRLAPVGFEDRKRTAQGGSHATAQEGDSWAAEATHGCRARTTKSTARAAKPAAARTRTPPATAKAKAAEPGVEAAEQRIRELNERIIDAGKRAGRGTLDIYESTLKAVSDSLERGPGSSDIEWVSSIATAQANFLRDLTKAWTSAARKALK